MRDEVPVTIGMPVYNGEKYVESAILSLLAQTDGDFLLLVSDNASSDRTAEICQDLAACDRRVKYVRQESNRGAAWNFNCVFRLSHSPFFMWAAHDDLWEGRFIERCRQQLEEDGGAIFCCTGARLVDDARQVVLENLIPPLGISSRRVEERVAALLQTRPFFYFYGLARRTALNRTHLMRPVASPDIRFLMELNLQGRTAIVPETLFTYRVAVKPEKLVRTEIRGPNEIMSPMELRFYTVFKGLVADLLASPLSFRDKLKVARRVQRIREWRAQSPPDALNFRGVVLSELATDMKAALPDRRLLRFLRFALVRTMIDPSTPHWVADRLWRRLRHNRP